MMKVYIRVLDEVLHFEFSNSHITYIFNVHNLNDIKYDKWMKLITEGESIICCANDKSGIGRISKRDRQYEFFMCDTQDLYTHTRTVDNIFRCDESLIDDKLRRSINWFYKN